MPKVHRALGNLLFLESFPSLFTISSEFLLSVNSLHILHHFISLYLLFFCASYELFRSFFSFLSSFHLLFVLSSLTHHLSRWLSPLPSPSLYTPLLRCTSPLSSHSDSLAMGYWAPALAVSFWGYWVHYFPFHPHPVQPWRFKVPLVSVPSLNIARTTTARGCNSSP